jgi:hypothetical protein
LVGASAAAPSVSAAAPAKIVLRSICDLLIFLFDSCRRTRKSVVS